MEESRSAVRDLRDLWPLLEMLVDGNPMGAGYEPVERRTFDVTWNAASVTIPMTRVELVVNGVTRESLAVDSRTAEGHFLLKLDHSSWAALLVRAVPGSPRSSRALIARNDRSRRQPVFARRTR